MNYMRDAKQRRKEKKNKLLIGIITCVCVIISIYLLAILKVPFMTKVSSAVVGFVDGVTGTIVGVFKDGTSFFGNTKKLNKKIEELEEELAKAKQLQVELDALEVENEDLRELLKIEENYSHFEKVYANIVSRNYETWNETFVINKGSKDGIEKRQTVIAEQGLVGYISEVNETTSVVTTILEPGTSVSVQISNINKLALIKGEYNLTGSHTVKLVNIPIDTELAEGEKVYTTGIGGLYKKGIPVGIIKSIKNRKNEIDRYAIVETFVNLDSLDMVGIIVK